ncbi:MAG: nucleotidyltransferase domain-containing protein [Candidatus Bipolaricaulota bacterium]
MTLCTPSLLHGPSGRASLLVDRAIERASAVASARPEELWGDLRAGDPWAHSAFRYALAEELCDYLKGLGPMFKAAYIYGSVMEHRARPASDLDIVLWVRRKSEAAVSLVGLLDALAIRCYRNLCPEASPRHLFDAHLVDDDDIRQRRGYGAVISSLHTAPVCLWRRGPAPSPATCAATPSPAV